MLSTENAALTREWSTGWWLWKKTHKVEAEQIDLPPEYGDFTAAAKVAIYEDGRLVHDAEIPWAMPKAEIMLALQVYMLAKQPNYPHPQFQPILEQFAFMCEGFEPPSQMWWGEEPLLD